MKRTGYFHLIWASKGLLVLFAVVAAVVVYLVSGREADQYESKALGQIVSTSQAEGEILNDEQLLSLSNLYGELAKTSAVMKIADEDPAVQSRTTEFNSSVAVEPEARVGLLGFSATTEEPELSASFANAYAEAFATYLNGISLSQRKESLVPIQKRINEINAQLGETEPTSPDYAGLQVELQALQDQIASESSNPGDTLRVIEPAVPTASPVSPKPTRNAILALIGALVLGAALVYLRDLLFDRYRSGDEAARDLDLPLIGEIPSDRSSQVLESFRTLRTAVMLLLEQSMRSTINGPERATGDGVGVLVTGAEPGSGKSYVTANLARTMAAEGRRVTVIDGDLRRPTLAADFQVPTSPGLSDLLLSEGEPRITDIAVEVESQSGAGQLRVVPPGGRGESAVESLSSERMRRAVTELRIEDDVILFDSPPTLVVVDPVVLSRYVDGVVFVIDSRRTRRRDARRAVEALRATGAPLLGFAFNRSSVRPTRYDSYRPRELRREPWHPKDSKV